MRGALAAIALLSACAGCRQATHSAVNSAADAQAAQPGYQPAPDVSSAEIGPGGQVILTGAASPGMAVRLASPGGAKAFATADAAGRWRIELAPSAAPRLLGLSMSGGGPVVQAMGYVFVAPDGEAARLRAGGGTEVLAPGAPGLEATALDYDNRRAATLSGLAPPGDTVILRVDGVERGRASAGQGGRFTISLNEPLDAGSHLLDLAGDAGSAQAKVAVDAPRALGRGPFVASRQGADWRIDWLTPGGGEQTTLILSQPRAGQ